MGLAMPQQGVCMFQMDLEGHGYSQGERAYIENYWHWVDDFRLVRGGGGTRLLLAFSDLTFDHASLSRRSTVSSPNRHLQRLGARYVFVFVLFFFHMLHKERFACLVPFPVWPFWVYHVSRRITIVFSLLSSVPGLPMSTYLVG